MDCQRAKSGSLFPAEATWSTMRTAHCRDCGRDLIYTKRGIFEHKEK